MKKLSTEIVNEILETNYFGSRDNYGDRFIHFNEQDFDCISEFRKYGANSSCYFEDGNVYFKLLNKQKDSKIFTLDANENGKIIEIRNTK